MLGIYTIMATTGAKRENITCQADNDARLPLCQFLFITRHWQIECHEQAARDLQTACGRQLALVNLPLTNKFTHIADTSLWLNLGF